MSKLSRSVTIEAPAERAFAYVDDIRNLTRHMSESRSMPMMGRSSNWKSRRPNRRMSGRSTGTPAG